MTNADLPAAVRNRHGIAGGGTMTRAPAGIVGLRACLRMGAFARGPKSY